MPRETRQFEIGDTYHVINRGVDKRKIFLKNQDYSRFILGLEFFNQKQNVDVWEDVTRGSARTIIERLKEERIKKGKPIVELLAFVLMPNHFHLVIRETIKNGTSLFMKKIGGYVTYFNKQYNRTGSLFQSRYKAVPVFDEQKKLVFNYVHTNPVELQEKRWKEGKVKEVSVTLKFLESYKWSSYRDYIGFSTFPTTTNRDFFIKLFSGGSRCRRSVEKWVQNKGNYMNVWE